MPSEAYIYDGVRTPRGRGKDNGALHGTKPITLVTGLIDAVQKRNPGLDPKRIEDVVLGIVTPIGEQGGDLARAAALVAGLPDTTGGVQLNRFCASGLEAVNQAASRIRSGWEHLILAGGVESMSRNPMGSDGGAWFLDPETALATSFVPQGISADLIATIEGFTRDDVDGYAIQSQERAAKAIAGGAFSRSIVPVRDPNGLDVLTVDEHPRPDTTRAGLGKLRPSFAGIGEQAGFDAVALQKYHWLEAIEHVHHAGNSSGIVDGAALVAIGSEEIGRNFGLVPRARIVGAAVSGADPTLMLTGPTPATEKALSIAGLSTKDIDLFEINEAFAAVVLKYIRDLDLDPEKVNVNGGAIALGHPLGATGAMLVGTVVDELERRDLHRAVVTLCIGGGMGVATVIERVTEFAK
ncbi:acetyl-CoA acetyltransferase [Actinoplanes ianthinogenes]|uniref:Acetyl-CoA acetyltransferase n=1 Tax=Actinoplanes ianthinogenes TaxID=122358 RepID=A0ABN6CMS3_9ACTN|nr:acetyl-CoA C-acetyltransferase [Actinoplanes ianthinogenes]BCJ46440.1 acetyl-CoA acetyltransferase [Actinoplanes ianthinogenes]GGR34267.1 acetyl-CoA acetyltransferase [Actinoplanes ianthinogenes]